MAVIAIALAALFAWRARPRVDGVPAPPAVVAPLPEAADVGTRSAGPGPAAGPASGEVVVAVAGKVRRPGLVRLPTGARVADAVQAAGGADPRADIALLNLARKVVDGELILVGVTPPGGPAATGAAAGAIGGSAGAGGSPTGGPINLNTATLAELDTLPGVGPVLAQRILDRRAQSGGFRAVSDLRKVEGIGSARYEQLKALVTV